MKFFIDTANIDEIKKAHGWGLIDGVTTNPTLIAKERKQLEDVVPKILEIVDGPVSVEVIATEAAGMIEEGIAYAKYGKNVVVKVPMTTEGLKALKEFSRRNIKTNVTLVFSPNQALIAAKGGATYVSPFVGRLDDVSHNGMDIVKQILVIFNNYGFETQVLVASVRHPVHVLEAALMGAHVATMPFNVVEKLASHPLTDKGISRFLSDWDALKRS